MLTLDAQKWALQTVALLHIREVKYMSVKNQVLAGLIFLGIVDTVIPIPFTALILVYVVLQQPTWFTDMVRDIYGS